MEDKLITKEEKGEIYGKLHERLKKALKSGFWLEATMIDIEQQLGKKHPILCEKVSPKTLQEIKEWKKKRNTAVHKACYTLFEEEDFKAIAKEGKELVRNISNDSLKVKRACEKGYAK